MWSVQYSIPLRKNQLLQQHPVDSFCYIFKKIFQLIFWYSCYVRCYDVCKNYAFKITLLS